MITGNDVNLSLTIHLHVPTKMLIFAFYFNRKRREMAEYALRLESEKDYRIIKKLLKAFEGATITPVKKKGIKY